MTKLLLMCLCSYLVYAQEPNKAYSKFDFIPGDKIVYVNNFETDAKGELPIGWNTNASGETVSLLNQSWVKFRQNALYITDNSKSFTGDFTAEFDLFLDFKGTDAMFPQVSFGILSSGAVKPNSNAVLQNIFQHQLVSIDFNAGLENNSVAKLVSFNKGNEYFNSGEKAFKQLESLLNKTIHISIQVQQQRFRLWVNEIKLFDVPQAMPENTNMNQLFFRLSQGGFSDEQVAVFVTNIKVAKGVADTRNKLLTEGKFSTTGILFDVNSAVIKPESYGIIKEIADVLKSNPSLKILIVGHTDADGNDADNLLLSKQRSEAVKQLLIKEYNVAAANIGTDGKGESVPVGDNKTKEGKAQNRRVEFIKQ